MIICHTHGAKEWDKIKTRLYDGSTLLRQSYRQTNPRFGEQAPQAISVSGLQSDLVRSEEREKEKKKKRKEKRVIHWKSQKSSFDRDVCVIVIKKSESVSGYLSPSSTWCKMRGLEISALLTLSRIDRRVCVCFGCER